MSSKYFLQGFTVCSSCLWLLLIILLISGQYWVPTNQAVFSALNELLAEVRFRQVKLAIFILIQLSKWAFFLTQAATWPPVRPWENHNPLVSGWYVKRTSPWVNSSTGLLSDGKNHQGWLLVQHGWLVLPKRVKAWDTKILHFSPRW